MIEIKDLLARFSNVLLKEELKQEAVREVISKVIRFDIPSEGISLKNGTVYLDIKPIYKSEILLKRDRIDELLRQALNKENPYDIR
ncbi:MAG: hypothetical protein WDN09_00830 [bacterium]